MMSSEPCATQARQQPAQAGRQIDSPHLSAEEAIVYLRLADRAKPFDALYRLVTQHRLPHLQRSGLYLFDKRELDAWVRGFGSALEMAGRKSACAD